MLATSPVRICPGDIVARYHRLKGNNVLMVSGTDSHGTPVTIAADKEGKPVEEVYKKYHNGFLELFEGYGITYDLFTTTHTENHFKVTQAIFLALKENGFLYTDKSMQWYSPSTRHFLPDRYVEGTCYICGFEGARSDQCDNCGNVLEPEKLINPRSKEGGALELRETEHFYLDLSKLEPDVKEFLTQRQSYCATRSSASRCARSNPKVSSRGRSPVTWTGAWISPSKAGPRPASACTSGSKQSSATSPPRSNGPRFQVRRKPGASGGSIPAAKQFYFIGKDNIFFHAAWWPAELMGAGAQFLKIFAEDEKVR